MKKQKQSIIILGIGLSTLLSFVASVSFIKGNLMASFSFIWGVSLILFVCGLVITAKGIFEESSKSLKSKLLLPILLLFLSIWALRFNIEIHTSMFDIEALQGIKGSTLGFFEHILNSMVHGLQSFSMDEDYSDYILRGRQFILEHFSGDEMSLSTYALAYGLYCAFLNACAPILGGAVIFDIITDYFPEIQLTLQLIFHPNTVNYVFSEMNEKSIVIAESIHKTKKNSFIVFTDAYVADAEEQPSELLARAKEIGAMCLTTDLSILKRLARGPVRYFILDDAEAGNIESLAALSDTVNKLGNDFSFIEIWKKYESDVKIYVFSDSPIMDQMIEYFNKKCEEENLGKVIAKPVNQADILSHELIRKYPLYKAVFEAKKPEEKEEISILIIGDDAYTRAFMKNAYWCGQMINPYTIDHKNWKDVKKIRPVFHIICEDKKALKDYMSSQMPAVSKEIAEGKLSYASWHIYEHRMSFHNLKKDIEKIGAIDWCLISNGSDLRNIDLCHMTKRILDQRYLLSKNYTDILCIVENPELNRVNQELNPKEDQIPIHYVGSHSESFHIEAIEKLDLEEEAAWIDQSHEPRNKRALYSNLYNYRSSLASACHYQYKLFSAGIFDKDSSAYSFDEVEYTIRFLEKLFGLDLEKDHSSWKEGCINALLWLEKKRWNAFVKTEGFEQPSLEEVRSFHEMTGTYKLHGALLYSNRSLSLHACLMELPEPIGIVLEKLKEAPNFYQIKEAIEASFECDQYPKNTSFEDFLGAVRKRFCGDWTIDNLDIFSIIVGYDYKSYDFEQIPVVSFNRFFRKYKKEDAPIKRQRILAFLKAAAESDLSIAGEFKGILKTVENFDF